MSTERHMPNRIRRLIHDEDGAVAVEAVLWIPVFLVILLLITDASFAFFGKAQAFRIIENGNRAYSTGRFGSSTEALENWIEAEYASVVSSGASVESTESGGLVETVMTIPLEDLAPFSSFDVISGRSITVRAKHYVE